MSIYKVQGYPPPGRALGSGKNELKPVQHAILLYHAHKIQHYDLMKYLVPGICISLKYIEACTLLIDHSRTAINCTFADTPTMERSGEELLLTESFAYFFVTIPPTIVNCHGSVVALTTKNPPPGPRTKARTAGKKKNA